MDRKHFTYHLRTKCWWGEGGGGGCDHTYVMIYLGEKHYRDTDHVTFRSHMLKWFRLILNNN